MWSSQGTIAFFGGTGGCCFAALCLTLREGKHTCYALVRNEASLRTMLEAQSIDKKHLENLTIIQGDIQDVPTVRKVIAPNGVPVDLVVSGVGARPQVTYFPPSMRMENPTICETATRNMLTALRQTRGSKKPTICVISTTGIDEETEDVPILMRPLYHGMLRVPHKDKKAMEDLLIKEMQIEGSQRTTEGFAIVRPSLLTDGAFTSLEKIRVGDEKNPAVGYMISRNDVGMFIFERVVKGVGIDGGVQRVFSITY